MARISLESRSYATEANAVKAIEKALPVSEEVAWWIIFQDGRYWPAVRLHENQLWLLHHFAVRGVYCTN